MADQAKGVPIGEPEHERLRELLNTLLSAEVDEKQRLVERHAELLLNPSAEAMLRGYAQRGSARGEEDAGYFVDHADLLADCRERGAPMAFAMMRDEFLSGRARSGLEEQLAELRTLVDEAETNPRLENFERQIGICGTILEWLPRHRARKLWAMLQGARGTALARLGELSGDAPTLQQAEAAYREALKERSRENAPMDWAMTQNNLGAVLQSLGELTGDAVALGAAETAFREALKEYTRDGMPMDWVGTLNNLGNLLQSLGVLTGDTGKLRDSEAAFYEILKESTRDAVPMLWAMTQNNLGNVLQSIGDLAGDPGTLLRAETAFREALKEYAREVTPMDWALTQSNLANVLACLGELTGDAATMQRSVTAYLEALEEYTREAAPMQWALTKNDLGTVLQSLGALTSEAATLQLSEAAHREALKEYTRERAPIDWAATQNNLGNVIGLLGELTRDAVTLEASAAAHLEALKEYTRERAPIDWAMSLNNLGIALNRLGELTDDLTALRRAEAAYRKALKEYTRERAPTRWAVTQNNLGAVMQRLGELSDNAELLQSAEKAYSEALDTYATTGDHDKRQGTAGRVAALLVARGAYSEASEITERAIAESDAALMQASRSATGRSRAVELVGDLFSLLSLCRLRQEKPDVHAALVAAATGRARLLADAINFDALRPEDISDPEIRDGIGAAEARRLALRRRLGYEQSDAVAPTQPSSSAQRDALQQELTEAGEAYMALCREHGLVRAPEPLSLADIKAAVPSGGALVLPVLTEREAYGFVLVEGLSEPTVIELPRLNRQEVVAHLSGDQGWLGAYNTRFSRHQSKDALAADRWRDQVSTTTSWLWERLLEPIHVQLRDVAKLERDAEVVLLPPGLLGLLPLHAAGPGPDVLTFGDHWTVSYAPSVRALATCQDRARQRKDLPLRFLAALDPDSTLPGARAEAAMLRCRFGGKQRDPAVLVGREATLAAVTGRLSATTCFHASTHGRHDSIQPARSGLKMSDGWLTLEALRHARLDAARLVFLSACESGLAGVRKLPEEFIGLPAGFVQAGAACVIGSLWPIRDDASFLLASRFYKEWLDEEGQERVKPAEALRAALDWLRRVTFGELRKLFAIESGGDGVALILRDSDVIQLPDIEEIEKEPPTKSKAIRLPLGPDDERPYDHPEFWAAFACTGA